MKKDLNLTENNVVTLVTQEISTPESKGWKQTTLS